MSNKGETLTDSSDSEGEKKMREKLRNEQKKSLARKRKHTEEAGDSAKKVAGNSKKQQPTRSAEGADAGEKISLGKMKFVSVREFKNMIFVDIREFYSKDGELRPGKKGVSLQAEQWQILKSSIDDIDEKIQQLC